MKLVKVYRHIYCEACVIICRLGCACVCVYVCVCVRVLMRVCVFLFMYIILLQDDKQHFNLGILINLIFKGKTKIKLIPFYFIVRMLAFVFLFI